jgi:hypothetical protein
MKLDRKSRKILFQIKKLQERQDIIHAKQLDVYTEDRQRRYNILSTEVYYLKKQLAKSIAEHADTYARESDQEVL